ncbi:hypothetical protein Rcae01_06594 [Novipirellula caenicola]|uniref:Uncharacterized protein n=1 Tax=Novipirellula caenicola TaxID=1536901 RepID=A0ABP9W125_9BACT
MLCSAIITDFELENPLLMWQIQLALPYHGVNYA